MIHKTMLLFLSLAALLFVGSTGGCMKRSAHERLKWKADEFFKDPGVISLCKAIEAKDLKKIDRLVKSGVNVNAKGRGNMTPLLWAFPMGEKVFEKMLDLGADPNVKLTGRLSLLCLVEGHSAMAACATPVLVESLLHNEYFPDVPMDNYLKLVLKHGGNPNIEDIDGETPLFYLKFSNPPKVSQRIRLLLDAGADINHKNWRGATALLTCLGSESDYMLCLLRAGADYRMASDGGWDLVLVLERLKMPQGPYGPARSALDREVALAKPVFDWLTKEGVDWCAARAALESPETMQNLKNLPADYKHRPWLPQRPTLKKPEAKPKKP
jgi:ankyrin repeat protein